MKSSKPRRAEREKGREEKQAPFPSKNHALLLTLLPVVLKSWFKKCLPLKSQNYFLKHGFCPCSPKWNINRIKEGEERARHLFIMSLSYCSVQILNKPKLFDPFLQGKYSTFPEKNSQGRMSFKVAKVPHLISTRIGNLTPDYPIPQPCGLSFVPQCHCMKY